MTPKPLPSSDHQASPVPPDAGPGFALTSPALGKRLVHSPLAGVLHVTSSTDDTPRLTGLVEKHYPRADRAAPVNQPGAFLSDSLCEIRLSPTGGLEFCTGDGTLLLRETGVERLPNTIGGTEYPSLRVSWETAAVDGVYGLGQYQDGLLNIRGAKREGHQKNLENCIPLWVSSLGFGILWDHPAPITVEAEKNGSSVVLQSLAADTVDYYFLAGPALDDVIARYRALTGQAPLPPRWAFGYHQSKERYKLPTEIREVAKRFRESGFPLDLIIQDWQYWGDHGWNACRFDAELYPDPEELIQHLHDWHIRYIISVWPSFSDESKGSAVYRELNQAGLLSPHLCWKNTQYYDAFSAKGREIVWHHAKHLFDLGVDGWWLDASEPELGGGGPAGRHQSVDDLAHFGPCVEGPFIANANPYPLYANKAFVDGQRSANSDKRVFILTRSAYSGIQRYGAFIWSGDVRCSWDTLKKQVPAGLGVTLSGVPYWNSDIGGFACAYPGGCDNPDFRELFVRWFQFGTFCAQFRAHGTSTPREPWRFGHPGEETYDTLLAFTKLRYRLLPYIYSLAWQVTHNAAALMRPLVMDYGDDPAVTDIGDQYCFGTGLMVAPVLNPAPSDRGDLIPASAFTGKDGTPGGLDATYFQGRNFEEERVSRFDRRIEFNWSKTPREGMGADPALDPVDGLEMDNFSVRWAGFMVPETTGDHRITVRADDGFRLFVDGERVGADWSIRGLVSMTYTVPLEQGRPTPLCLEYFHHTGTAVAELYWNAEPAQEKRGLAERTVYLPKGRYWFDFWTGETHNGGTTLNRHVPLSTMPLFVPSGTILPLGPDMQHSGEKRADPLDIRVYAGQDAEFELYEDTGDGFAYQQGEYAVIPFRWDDAAQELHVGTRRGSFPDMLEKRQLHVTVWHPSPDGTASVTALEPCNYAGKPLRLGLS